MKNSDQIRQLLKEIIAVTNAKPCSASDVVYRNLANKALALLPCETCNGSGKKMADGYWGMMHKEIPCPDCQ